MNESYAEQWFHYGATDLPGTDIRLANDAVLRLYPDGSTIWKTRSNLMITPCVWDDLPEPIGRVTID
jgi:hypothetical protein